MMIFWIRCKNVGTPEMASPLCSLLAMDKISVANIEVCFFQFEEGHVSISVNSMICDVPDTPYVFGWYWTIVECFDVV